jgi:hypothetical protein
MYPFQQRAQYPQVAPSNPPSTQPQPSQPPTGQALAAQRTTQLIAGQFPPVQNEQQYSTQPQYSPPPTQSQFQIQQTQFPSPAQFSQTQAQGRGQSQFAQPHVPSQSHVTTQSHGAQAQSQVHALSNPQQQQQSQHYPAQSDSYYLQSDMYYAMNAQGSQSTPSLVSVFLLRFWYWFLDLEVFLGGVERYVAIPFYFYPPIWTGWRYMRFFLYLLDAMPCLVACLPIWIAVVNSSFLIFFIFLFASSFFSSCPVMPVCTYSFSFFLVT